MNYDEEKGLTQECREENQKYLLANLEKYSFDSCGNFVSNDCDDYASKYFCFRKKALSNWREIVEDREAIIDGSLGKETTEMK